MPDPARHWSLDSETIFLNHGSFGACPLPVLDEQSRWRAVMESQPVDFFVRRVEGHLDAARNRLAAFLGADPENLVWVPNATTGVNAVLRSLELGPGDELLTTDHAYNACRNALEYTAERSGATVVVAEVPFPISSSAEAGMAILDRVGPRTRLALVDHVTSPTGLVFPIGEIVAQLQARGVDTLVDGAHAPGMVPLDLESLGAAYYAGNCHKWLCAPKGAGFLHVRPDRQDAIVPTSISHGANSPRTDRSRFQLLFDWTGTADPTAYLAVPTALDFMAGLLPGGWEAVMAANRSLALGGRSLLCEALRVPVPAPEEMIGSLAAVPLPPADRSDQPPASSLYGDPLQEVLLERWKVEVPIVPWPGWPSRLVRVSAQVYNRPEQYSTLASALKELLD
ncbi:MAG TPA: aminotransferase class V-fold PLP-dependent enzyme [Acidimicrobiia bacterium]